MNKIGRIILLGIFALYTFTSNTNAYPSLSILFNEPCNDYSKTVNTNAIIIKHIINKYKNITKHNIENENENENESENESENENESESKNKNDNDSYTLNRVNKNVYRFTKKNKSIVKSIVKPNDIYNGEIILKYKTKSECVFYCKMKVIEDQHTEKIAQAYLDMYYNLDWIIDAFCNSKHCVYEDMVCNIIPIKDEF